MQYLGGKCRIAAQIAAVISSREPSRQLLVEPFCGGANATVKLAPHFERIHASDAHPDLVAMWQALATGWEPPETVSEGEYHTIKNSRAPSALRGFVGFGCSFGGKFFGGYARDPRGRDYCGAARRAVLRDIAVLRPRATFTCRPYWDAPVARGVVVYADPPYASTTGYNSVGEWDVSLFWEVTRYWRHLGARVYVSEYAAPPDWTPIWSATRTQGLRGKNNSRQEMLFV